MTYAYLKSYLLIYIERRLSQEKRRGCSVGVGESLVIPWIPIALYRRNNEAFNKSKCRSCCYSCHRWAQPSIYRKSRAKYEVKRLDEATSSPIASWKLGIGHGTDSADATSSLQFSHCWLLEAIAQPSLERTEDGTCFLELSDVKAGVEASVLFLRRVHSRSNCT